MADPTGSDSNGGTTTVVSNPPNAPTTNTVPNTTTDTKTTEFQSSTPQSSTSTSPPISVSYPGGTYLFNSQAELDAYSQNPGEYASSFVGSGYTVTKIIPPGFGNLTTNFPTIDNALGTIKSLSSTTPTATTTATTLSGAETIAATTGTSTVQTVSALTANGINTTTLNPDQADAFYNGTGTLTADQRIAQDQQTAANAATLYPGTNNTNLKNIDSAGGAIARNQVGIANAEQIIAEQNQELADPNISDQRRAELEANNASQENYIRLANDNTAEQELVIEANADGYAAGGGNEGSGQTTTPVDPTTLEGYGVQAAVDPTTLEGFGIPGPTPVDTNNSGEGFGNVFPDGFGGFVNGDGQPVDANGSFIPTGDNLTESAALVDPGTGGEGFGNVFPDGFGGFVNGDGQPTDANGSLIPTGDNLTQSAALVNPGTGGEGFDVNPNPEGSGGFVDSSGNPVDQFGMPIEAVQPTTYPPAEVAIDGVGVQENGAGVDLGQGANNAVADEATQTASIVAQAKKQATVQARYKQPGNSDWRVRLSLGPGAQYLYNATPAGVLAPLAANGGTDGVIFPYTPSVTTAYSANYEQYDLIHSNYRGLFYKNSRVGDIQLRGTFTAQNTTEANYLLATIHFFRSVTKMFYGQDAERGTPPPICLLNGFGGYQFSDHPVVVSSFNYTLPNDVDYIRTTNPNNFGLDLNNRYNPSGASLPAGGALAGVYRLLNAIPGGLNKGALPRVPAPNTVVGSVTNNTPASYVPTKMEIDVTLIPVQSRSQVSQQFSLKGFANGDLLKGGFW